MVYVDRWLILGIVGTIGMVVSAAGEFLGWWDQAGEFGFWLSVALALLGYLTNATRAQGREIRTGLGRTETAVGRVEQGVSRVEQGVSRVEQGVSRVEQGVSRVEQGVSRVEQGVSRVEQGVSRVEQGVSRVEQGVSRVESNTAETNALLREIRDRLPPARA